MALEAFKAGAYDFRIEPSPKSWATQYQGGNFARNYIIKQDETNQAAQNTRWLAFNMQNRCSPIVGYGAIGLAFDFNWMNKALYYNAYQRADSYFQNTAYAARGYPDAAELACWHRSKAGAAGGVHQHLSAALLRRQRQRSAKSAESDPTAERSRLGGQNQKLVNAKTGQPFAFELMLLSGSNFHMCCRSATTCSGWASRWQSARLTPRNIRAACANATSI